MKRFLILFVIITGMNFAGSSTILSRDTLPSPDTLCFPVEVVRERVKDAKEAIQLRKLVDNLNNEIRLLDRQMVKNEQIISEYKAKEGNYIEMLKSYSRIQDELTAQRNLLDKTKNEYKRKLKWANTKTVIVGILGLALVVLTNIK